MTMESSNMLAPVHYDAKVTPQHPNTTLNIFHPCCAWLCTPENAQRADQDVFFLWGSRASHMPYHQKDVTMESSHFTLCSCCTFSLCFSTLKQGHCILLCVESTKHIHFSNISVYFLFCSEQQKRCTVRSVCAII